MFQSLKVKAAQSNLTLCDPMDYSLPGSSVHGDSPDKNTGAGCHFLLQGIFLSQGLNPDLLRRKQILYHLNHQGRLSVFWWVWMLSPERSPWWLSHQEAGPGSPQASRLEEHFLRLALFKVACSLPSVALSLIVSETGGLQMVLPEKADRKPCQLYLICLILIPPWGWPGYKLLSHLMTLQLSLLLTHSF